MLKKISKQILAVLTMLAFASSAYAIVSYAPSAGLGLGSVRSTHIRDNDLTGSDIATTANLQIAKLSIGTSSPSALQTIWSATTTGQLAFNVVTVGSSTAFSILDNSRIGIGTSSPMSAIATTGTTTTIGLQTPSGVKLSLPTTAGTSGQVLKLGDGSSTSWQDAGGAMIAVSGSDVSYLNSTASTTIATATIPGGTLGTGKAIRVTIPIYFFSMSGGQTMAIGVTYGSTGGAYCLIDPVSAADVNSVKGTVSVLLFATGATNTQEAWINSQLVDDNGSAAATDNDEQGCAIQGTATTDSTADQTLTVQAKHSQAFSGLGLKTYGYLIEKIQ
ncbi:MAG: hypothetical protein WCV87_03785 [Candidatus Paceibacterota bacterium]|jgi:hypothetical protein